MLFPAPAGIIPAARVAARQPSSFPCLCGDDPTIQELKELNDLFPRPCGDYFGVGGVFLGFAGGQGALARPGERRTERAGAKRQTFHGYGALLRTTNKAPYRENRASKRPSFQ